MDSQLREMCIENRKNGLPQSLTSILEEMNRDQGENFDPEKVNLAELERRTGGPDSPGAGPVCALAATAPGGSPGRS